MNVHARRLSSSSSSSGGSDSSSRESRRWHQISSSSSSSTSLGKKTRHDYLVVGLEDVEPSYGQFEGIMYAGLVPTSPPPPPSLQQQQQSDDSSSAKNDNKNETGELMFWLFVPDQPVYPDTLLVWFNGGPGCSSMGGNLFEHGPVTIPLHPSGFFGIGEDEPLQYNPYAWSNATAIIYVEQPHGTGFSRGPFPSNETDVGRDFYNFLQNLYTIFDEDATDADASDTGASSSGIATAPATTLRDKKLHLFGESYAGMYVPSIAHYIHQENKKQAVAVPTTNEQRSSSNNMQHVNLAGIGLGNGWMDATVQGPAVIDYALWHGMIDSHTAQAMHTEWENCRPRDVDGRQPTKKEPEPFHPFTPPDECGIMGAVLAAAGAGILDWGTPNAYDVTTMDN
jgi:Serine carboxypeptidase